MSRTARGKRRTFWLWPLVLWLMALGTIGLWRSLVWWQTRNLLAELGSRVSPPALVALVVLSGLVGLGLWASAGGLWCRQEWARQSARVLVLSYYAIVQAYTWLYAQSGLLWARRWVSLILAVLGLAIAVGALSWRTSRRWLGLQVPQS